MFIQICPTCMRYRNMVENDKAWYVPEAKVFKEIWMQAIYHFLVSHIPGHDKLDFFIDFVHEPDVLDSGRKKIVWFELTGRELDSEDPREATERIQLKYSIGTCNDCAQKRVGYHNSVIQLRTGMKRAENEGLLERMTRDVQAIAAQSSFHGTAQVTSIEPVAGGVDIKLASKRIGKVIAGQLRKKYCVDIKESFKLVGIEKETGTPTTRLFYAIRLQPFLPGDVLLLPRTSEPCLVLKTTSAMLHLISLVSGKIERAKPEVFTEDSIVFQSGKDRPIEFQVVSLNEADGTMNLMDTATFEERVEAMHPWLGVNTEGVTITGFHFADTIYLFPLDREIHEDDDSPAVADVVEDDAEDVMDDGPLDDESDEPGDDIAGNDGTGDR